MSLGSGFREHTRETLSVSSRANGSFLSENDPITAPFYNFGSIR
jgi:hypothetical protein